MYDVVLVDDEQIILQGLSQAFPWAVYDCRVVGTAVDGRDGLAMVRQKRPHLLFTDIRMPNLDGLSMLAALKSEFPATQITVLTAFREFEYAKQAIRLGVCRYLLKPSRMDELHEAVATMIGHIATPRMRENLTPSPSDPCPVSRAQTPCEPEDESPEAGCFVLRAAMQYIADHCTEHLSLSDVADHVYVSQWHLSKLINRHAQQSFFDLLNHCRIQRAQAMLSDPAYKIIDVAFSVGYADVAHFSRVFKKTTGKTPLEYRATL